MQRIAHRFSRNALCCAIPALLVLPAFAGTPAALDRVPQSAQAVVVVPDVGELLNDINAINTILGDNGEPMVMMVTSMVRGMPGINLNGSMAGVLQFQPNQEDPDVLMLLPVNDYEAFSQGQKAVNGVNEFPMGDQKMYMRDLGGGYAVMGEFAEMVRNYDGAAGNLNAHSAALGKAGGRIADHNDIFFYVNIPQFQDQINMGMAQMEDQAEMVAMMGGEEAAQGFDQMVSTMRAVADDALSFSAGLSFDQNAGVSFDFGLQFKSESSTAGYFNNNGGAEKYFNNVPNMDYFFAASYDMSGTGIQKFMSEYMAFVKKMDTSGMVGAMNIEGLISGMKGGVQVMGASDNIMGGLFTNSFYYAEVDNPNAYIDSMRTMYESMDAEMDQQGGVTVDANVAKDATQINGANAYAYNFTMDMSQMQGMNGGMGGPNPAMIMQMMFGGNGPSGYLAPVGEHGLIATMSQNPELLTKAINGAKGENTMAGVAAIKQTRDMLPDNRIMEMYVAADHLANTAGPMAMMFGLIPEFEPVESLPPIGMGLTADGGGMLFRTVLPMQTIVKSMEIANEMQQLQQGGGNQNEMDF
jgi:hypothetical protein